jgi:hypothetical protein
MIPKYIRIYMDYFDIKENDIWWDEAMGTQHLFREMNVHHIWGRGKGKDVIENLMCLQVKTHARAHGTKKYVSKEEFQLIHNYFLAGSRKQFLI